MDIQMDEDNSDSGSGSQYSSSDNDSAPEVQQNTRQGNKLPLTSTDNDQSATTVDKNRKNVDESRLPLYMRLKAKTKEQEKQEKRRNENALSGGSSLTGKRQRQGDGLSVIDRKDYIKRLKRSVEKKVDDGGPDGESEGMQSSIRTVAGKKKKNAPAEMPSNKPVRRLRIDADNSTKKTVDPRFSDVSGKLDERHYMKNYSFLDDYHQSEMQQLAKMMKKTKNVNKKEELKEELRKMKQTAAERQRSMRVAQRVEALKQEEKEKVREGKQPYFLKRSVTSKIAVEEKFKDLKRAGKLKRYMERRQHKLANKEHKKMPTDSR